MTIIGSGQLHHDAQLRARVLESLVTFSARNSIVLGTKEQMKKSVCASDGRWYPCSSQYFGYQRVVEVFEREAGQRPRKGNGRLPGDFSSYSPHALLATSKAR